MNLLDKTHEIFKTYDKNSDKQIVFDEFQQYLLIPPPTEDYTVELVDSSLVKNSLEMLNKFLKMRFHSIDNDKSGELSIDELQREIVSINQPRHIVSTNIVSIPISTKDKIYLGLFIFFIFSLLGFLIYNLMNTRRRNESSDS